jgi:hypothetical protein
MNENENSFESLRCLLASKNRELPPPGYFNDFSAQVVNRIRAGEASEPRNAAEQLFAEAPWLLKFLQIFEAKPAFAGAFAFALCLVLIFGMIYAERPDTSAPQPLLEQVADNSSQLAALPATALSQPSDSIMLASDNTNPVNSVQPVASLFGQQNPFVQQVGFTVPGN